MKYIITFGSSQLDEFCVNPTSVALIIEAENEMEARKIVFEYPGIGERFCTSYPYASVIDEFINDHNCGAHFFS
jgi:hypothetical protein